MANSPNKKQSKNNWTNFVFTKYQQNKYTAIAVFVVFLFCCGFFIFQNTIDSMPAPEIMNIQASLQDTPPSPVDSSLPPDNSAQPNASTAPGTPDNTTQPPTPDTQTTNPTDPNQPQNITDTQNQTDINANEPLSDNFSTGPADQARIKSEELQKKRINTLTFILVLFIILVFGGFTLFTINYYKKNSKKIEKYFKNKAKNGQKGLTFANDEKQAIMAIISIILFLAYGTYMIGKNVIDQLPPPHSQPSRLEAMTKAQNAQNTTSEAQTTSTTLVPTEQGTTGTNPEDLIKIVIPVVILIFFILVGIGLVIYKKNIKAIKKQLAQTGEASGKKLLFAKSPQEAIAAIIMLSLFISVGIYLIAKNVIDKMPVQTIAQVNPTVNNTTNQVNGEQSEQGGMNQDANNIYSQTMNLQGNQQNGMQGSQNTAPGSDVEILTQGSLPSMNQKMVTIPVTSSGRSNPFLPASENISPHSLAYLTAPPETLPTNSDAGKVMTTVISGILYDKLNPSAIINIEGTDYLVKKGDIINRYQILSITKNQVIVQLGPNIYQAGVGELLSQTNINYNTIANLNKKFGGNSVSIGVRKKK